MEEEIEKFNATQVKKRTHRFEIVLLLVLGLLVGFSVKTEASKRVTMGSSDYLLTQKDVNAYDLNKIQKDLAAQGGGSTIAPPQAAGGSCGQ